MLHLLCRISRQIPTGPLCLMKRLKEKKKGTKLRELPVSVKVQWKDWVEKFPNTLVLSVDSLEDASAGYISYFNSTKGFRGIGATDQRLESKEPIFAFDYQNKKYAVANDVIEGGKVFDLGNIRVFLYRPEGSEMFYSTIAFQTKSLGFTKVDDKWLEIGSDCVFNPKTGIFSKDRVNCPERLNGFDTFWYTWSLNNPNTVLLGTAQEEE